MISINQAAEILRCSRSQIYVLISRGKLTKQPRSPVYLKGGPVGIPLSEVLALLPPSEREGARGRLG